MASGSEISNRKSAAAPVKGLLTADEKTSEYWELQISCHKKIVELERMTWSSVPAMYLWGIWSEKENNFF